jgi:hypothetical protein
MNLNHMRVIREDLCKRPLNKQLSKTEEAFLKLLNFAEAVISSRDDLDRKIARLTVVDT